MTSIRASRWSTLRAIQRIPTGKHPPTAPGWRGTGRIRTRLRRVCSRHACFTDEPQGESLAQPQGGEPREATRGVPTDRIRLEGNPAVLNSIATSVATTVVCTDEPQGESLVKPQGGDPKEPNRGGPQGRNRLTSIRASHWSTLRAIQRNPTGHPPTAPGWRGTGRR